MELGGQKKRTVNFSSDEKRILSELVLKYQNVVENKRTDAATNSMKLKGWIRLAEEFNTISTYCHRTHTVLKCCWENIKRQTKKDRAARKKSLFMTGGGKPPSPSPSYQGSTAVVEAILGPALEGISNIYDSDAFSDSVIKDVVELRHPVDKTFILEDNAESAINNENIDLTLMSMTEVRHNMNITNEDNNMNVEDSSYQASTSKCILKETNENIDLTLAEVRQPNNKEDDNMNVEESSYKASTSKGILKENNEGETWSSWTPRHLKTPLSKQLRPETLCLNEENWLKRRRPKQECLGDTLTREKIKLVKILQENAEKESRIRLSILEEQLKQEKLKTQKLENN